MSSRKPTLIDQAVKPAELLAVDAPWDEPLPLVTPQDQPDPYPIQALPKVMREAVLTYQSSGQQPLAMVACSALAAASLACQGLVNVARYGGLIGACSLSFCVIAESGERKTSVDKRMAREIRRWEQERRDAMAPQIRRAQAEYDNWEARISGLRQKIKTGMSKTGEKAEADRRQLEAEVLRLEAARPQIPIEPRLFLEDATPEALAIQLADGHPSVAIWSDEGGLVVGSHAMGDESALRYLALLNRLWDAPEQGIFQARVTRASTEVRGRRVTVNLMLQGAVAARLVGAQDGISRHVGSLARMLICKPTSTMGTRLFVLGDDDAPALQDWDNRLRELLDQPLPLRDPDDPRLGLKPLVLRFDEEAFQEWVAFHDQIERQLKASGEFALVRDFASKCAEQVARIAAIFHVLEHGPNGSIGKAAVLAAIQVALWHLLEARRILSGQIHGEAMEHAQVLLEWLQKLTNPPSLKDVLHKGPARLRKQSCRDIAIKLLMERNLIRLEKREATTRLILSPRLGELA